MSLLFRVIYAAHAKGTHHKLALDALAKLDGPDSEGWRRLFLKHAEAFMVGAKAPDDVFKDFKNHVLHPRDGYWGGAPATARLWYGKTVSALQKQCWPEAVHAAGILSHYVTDAVHPFHTGQSEAEGSIHRAFEWSTAKSYDALKAIVAGQPAPEIVVPDQPDWLEEMLRTGATRANRHYEKLIAHYDINRGVVDPPAGLDIVAQRIVGNLIEYASSLYAIVLQRALTEANVAPAEVSLGLDTVLATLQIPIKTLQKRLADTADRKLVERMYDELRATGTVEENLPEDDCAIRDLHRAEVLGDANTLPAPAQAGTTELTPLQKAPAVAAALTTLANRLTSAAGGTTSPASFEQAGPTGRGSVPQINPRTIGPATTRSRLSPTDDIVDAPSIGPRMAERLRPLGLKTVDDLLSVRPESVAEALDMPNVTAETIIDWQAQARLVCTVPGLSGTGAQLLVGAGYRTGDRIASAEPDRLCADVLAYAGSTAGRRLLRDGEPPDIARIRMWAENARLAAAA